ncbi:unnamed protein product [Staurois parvus]|uniref:Uncharacterized protein n=1 Tax=Staurois parvus TaxID=386267 RepID=A0ABN9BXT0_9NEOB|nr:unnamed protein product [Staurois parvus]
MLLTFLDSLCELKSPSLPMQWRSRVFIVEIRRVAEVDMAANV